MGIQKEGEEEEEVGKWVISDKVVEYLEPVMSRELLCKYPDNSAFDFDYSQSSIWSPLVPRPYSLMDLDTLTPRKLSYEEDQGRCRTKVTPSKKKVGAEDFRTNLSKVFKMSKKKKKMVKKTSGFSPTPTKNGCVPITAKGWSKVLKAATKHFKKTKKKDPTVHVKLCNYLRGSDI